MLERRHFQTNTGPAETERADSVPVIRVAGLPFKDLNRNGRLDVYEDWRKSPRRTGRRFTAANDVEEKAGVMMHGTAPANAPAGMGRYYDLAQATSLIRRRK